MALECEALALALRTSGLVLLGLDLDLGLDTVGLVNITGADECRLLDCKCELLKCYKTAQIQQQSTTFSQSVINPRTNIDIENFVGMQCGTKSHAYGPCRVA